VALGSDEHGHQAKPSTGKPVINHDWSRYVTEPLMEPHARWGEHDHEWDDLPDKTAPDGHSANFSKHRTRTLEAHRRNKSAMVNLFIQNNDDADTGDLQGETVYSWYSNVPEYT
jgi:hypothetical protein